VKKRPGERGIGSGIVKHGDVADIRTIWQKAWRTADRRGRLSACAVWKDVCSVLTGRLASPSRVPLTIIP